MTIDGVAQKETLFSMVKSTLDKDNSVIAYHDNSSSIRGYEVQPSSCISRKGERYRSREHIFAPSINC